MADSVPPPAPAPAPQPAAPAPAKKGNRTLIIVLSIIGGLLLLMGGCTVACTYFIGKKAKDFAETSQSNPAYAALGLMAAFHPDLEVVSKDPKTGVMVIKHKKTGETSTVDTTQYNEETIGKLIESIAAGKGVPVQKTPPKVVFTPTQAATEAQARAEAQVQAAETGTVAGFPDYVPVYPGSTQTSMSTAKDDGMLDFSFNYSATTDALPDVILDFYQQALEGAGFTVNRDQPGKNSNGPKGSLTALKREPYAEVHVTAETEYNGGVRLRVTGGEKRK